MFVKYCFLFQNSNVNSSFEVVEVPVVESDQLVIAIDPLFSSKDNAARSKRPDATRSLDDCVRMTDTQVYAQLLANQQQMMQQLSVLQSSVDHLMGQQSIDKPCKDTYSRSFINPIKTISELDELENKLKDKQSYNNLVSALTFVCGSSGKCRGLDSCYKLVDYFFSREFFLNCSWTGSTRDITEKKIPLKYYTRVRNCFMEIVRKSDINFTEMECEKFLKVVIKNAKPRLNNKINSGSKNRTKFKIVRSRAIDAKSSGQQRTPDEVIDELVQNEELVVEVGEEHREAEAPVALSIENKDDNADA